MLANLRRKLAERDRQQGIITPVPMPTMPVMPPPPFAQEMIVPPPFNVDPTLPPPITMEELGFVSDRGYFSPSAIPLWLQEKVM